MIAKALYPTVEKEQLGKLLGKRRSSRFSSSVAKKIDRLEQVLEDFMEPRLYYLVTSIDRVTKGAVQIEDGVTLGSPKLSKTMKDCEEMVCFVATIGEKVDGEISRLTRRKRISEAYILDSMGSVAVENMVEKFYQRMKGRYGTAEKAVTLRFSPGYCDWPVTDQKKLFRVMDSFPMVVQLTDTCLMTPRKSISGVFGVFPEASDSPLKFYNPCRDCERNHCNARRD